MSKVSRCAAALLALVCMCSSFVAMATPLPWVKQLVDVFVSNEFKVSVSFPAAYEDKITEQKDKDDKVIKSLSVSATIDEDLYMLLVTKHLRSTTGMEQELANSAVEGFVSTVQGKIINEKSYTQKGIEGKDVLVYLEESKKYIHYRVILVGLFQYQILIADEKAELSATGTAFMGSFKIL